MDGKNVPTEFCPKDGTKPLFNDPELSDVRFLVDGQTIYGHKSVLGLVSPVFKSMLFGGLKEQREEIEIEDLTEVGFKNALRYLYGFEIDFKLSELYESYAAADKYLLTKFNGAFFKYIKGKLNTKNSCLIYDQLMKIGEREEISLADVRTMIIERSKEAFESKCFTRIDLETLISLLSLDKLSIDEFDLLVAVSKWVDCEVHRQGLLVNDENRRRVFEPIKGYIVFTALTLEQIAKRKEIIELLTEEERGSLLLHQLNTSMPLKIELKTTRKAAARQVSIITGSMTSESGSLEYSYSRTMYLSVNRSIKIRRLETIYSGSAAKLSLTIQDSDGVDLGLKPECSLLKGTWSFSFNPHFVVEPNRLYTLRLTGDEQLTKEHLLSKTPRFKSPDHSSVVKVGPNPENPDYSGHHFLRGILFIPPRSDYSSFSEFFPIFEKKWKFLSSFLLSYAQNQF